MIDCLEFIGDSPVMHVDPRDEIVTLLQPSANYSKLVEFAGRWRIRRDDEGKPMFLAILENECRLMSPGRAGGGYRAVTLDQ